MSELDNTSLCYRCEHRARVMENGYGPRYECKETDAAVACCYMYSPVKPVVLKACASDDGPVLGPWMMSARSVRAGLMESDMSYVETEAGISPYWKPREEKSDG